MRTLALGLLIVGLALFLASWNAKDPPLHEATEASPPSRQVGATPPHRSAAPAIAVAGKLARESAHDLAEAPAPRSEPTAATLPSPRESPRALPLPPRVAAGASRDKRGTPGKESPEEVASALQSAEFESAMGPVARLYLAYFGRLPDFDGFQYYIDERDGGRSLAEIADEFAGSREFALRYGQVDDAGFLDRMSSNVFGAGLGPAERAFWLAQLESGALTRGQVMLALSESNGFRGATDNEVFVAIAYGEILRRVPDVADWDRGVAFLDAGNPRAALVAQLMAPARRATP